MVLLLTFLNLIPKLLLSITSLISFLLRPFKRVAELVYLSGLILTLGVVLLLAYSILFDTRNVRIERVPIEFTSLPKELDGLRIVQLSDIHLGSLNGNKTMIRRTVKMINELQADLILFTGDMVNNFSFETTGYVGELKKMQARYGKFAVSGNHDYGDYFRWPDEQKRTANLQATRDSISQMGFKLLVNENQHLAVADTAIYIVGVENWGHSPFPQYADLPKAMADIPSGAFAILMSHDPAHWEAQVLDQYSIPLTLAGHTHGFQFGIRIAGIEFSPFSFIQKYWGGLFRRNNQCLYVNRGLGTVGFPGRVGMRPEITLITLKRKE